MDALTQHNLNTMLGRTVLRPAPHDFPGDRLGLQGNNVVLKNRYELMAAMKVDLMRQQLRSVDGLTVRWRYIERVHR